MSAYNVLKQFTSIHEIAGVLSTDQMNVLANDIIYPYVQGGRDTRGFKLTPRKPAGELTYATLIKENDIVVMADHVAFDAYGQARITKGVEMLEGNIPNIVAHRMLSRNDYIREMKAVRDLMDANPEILNAVQQATFVADSGKTILGKKVIEMLMEHDARASYMRNQAVSKGKYTVSAQNNSSEFSLPEFDFKVPAANFTTLTGVDKFYSDSDNKVAQSSADPLAQWAALVDRTIDNKPFTKDDVEIECDYATLMRDVRHPSVRTKIGMSINPMLAFGGGSTDAKLAGLTATMSTEALVAAVESYLGVKFVTTNQKVSVEKFNADKQIFEKTPVYAFEPNVYVCHPKGYIGEIHRSSQMTVGVEAGAVGLESFLNGGDILLTYECNKRGKSQQWDTSEIILYVLTRPNDMQYLHIA